MSQGLHWPSPKGGSLLVLLPAASLLQPWTGDLVSNTNKLPSRKGTKVNLISSRLPPPLEEPERLWPARDCHLVPIPQGCHRKVMKILCRREKGGIHLLPSLQGPAPSVSLDQGNLLKTNPRRSQKDVPEQSGQHTLVCAGSCVQSEKHLIHSKLTFCSAA